MADIEELKQRARQGDRRALQTLRDMGALGRTTQATYPSTHQQRRHWFLYRLEAEDGRAGHLNHLLAYHLQGDLDPEALDASLCALVKRHQALNTGLSGNNGSLVGRVAPPPSHILELMEPAGTQGTASLTQALDQAESWASRPLDLAAGPQLKARLHRLESGQWLLALAAPATAADRTSLELAAAELAQLYRQAVEGAPPPSALALQFGDYARWEAKLGEETWEPLLFFWRHQLRPPLAGLEMGGELPPRPEGFLPRRVELDLGPQVSQRARELCRREGWDPRAFLAAALAGLVHRYSGQEEMAVGVMEEGRHHQGSRDLVGPLANLLPLRTAMVRGRPWRQAWAEAQGRLAQVVKHRDLPFALLVERLDPAKDLSRPPFCQAALAWSPRPPQDLDLGGAQGRPLESSLGRGRFDLFLDLADHGDSWRGGLIYDASRWPPAAAKRLARHLVNLLAAVTADPEQPLGREDLLDPEERRFLVSGCNTTQAEWPREATICDLFAAQARRSAQATALTWSEGSLSYGELDQRAERLAHHLRDQGVGPGTLVGVCLPRSPEVVVAFLAVLKAGGAYLPLDPAHPAERLEYMCADAGIRHAVAITAAAGAALAGVERLTLLDRDAEAIAQRPATPCPGGAGPADLAYCIYTSGSTGRPKGVLIEHRNVTRLLVNDASPFDFGPNDVWTLFHSHCFDFSVWEMYGALFHGGRLVLVPEPVTRDPGLFWGLIRREGVTVLNQTPSAFYALAREALRQSRAASDLRWVIFGGEALSPLNLREFHQARPEVRLVNMYGITETTVHVTAKLLGPAEIDSNQGNIGLPIPTTTLHLLDRDLQPVPLGGVGEICVGGQGVGRGYLGRTELTAQRFVADPFQPGGRLYRSGDLGRRLASGEVLYLGRSDDQVQIRGFRVEPAEVAAQLLAHPQVSEAVVLPRCEGDQEVSLTAYLVARGRVDQAELRDHLARELPSYMVPAHLVVLPTIPRTANGKVDKSALPAPDRSAAPREHVPPADETQALVAAVFAEVLGLERVGVEDDFFDLGGHSLKATQLVARLREALGLEVPVRAVFESPTVAGLCRDLPRLGDVQPDLPMPPLVPRPAREEPRLSFAQERLWFLEQLEGPGPANHIAGTVRLEGRLDADALAQALAQVGREQEALRTGFVSQEGRPRLVIQDQALPGLERVDLSGLSPGERQERARDLIRQAARRPFDLGRPPLMRALLIRLAPEEHLLVLVVHHLVADGWSLGVLGERVSRAYQALSQGQAPPDAAPYLQYADYALWQRAWLTPLAQAPLAAYWRRQLAGAPPLLELPYDRPRPAVQSTAGAMEPLALDAALVESLHELARAGQASLFMVLLAGLAVVLGRYAGREDLVIGTPVAGRGRPELEELIGLFANTLALRLDLSGDPTFAELVERARGVSLDAYAHQEMPFERLMEELGVERSPSHTPIFQVMLALQNYPLSGFSLPGLTCRAQAVETGAAKFDLTLFLEEGADGLAGWAEYNRDLFQAETIRRLLANLSALLAEAGAHPQRRLSQLEGLSATERRLVLEEWNQTRDEFPGPGLLHQRLAEQAAASPRALAVVQGQESLTYAELEDRAGRLAGRLIELGVGRDAVVGVCLERSPAMVVALLAVLKAGGAYLPLDPGYPLERLEYMAEDSRLGVLLTARALVPGLGGDGVTRLELDDPGLDLPPAPPPEFPTGDPEDLAYVIYTSGSTGRPKGVAVPHRALCNHMAWMQRDYPLTPADRVLQRTAFSFDASVWEFWAPLLSGARLVLAPAGGMLDLEAICQTVQDQGVTVMQSVPSLLRLLLEEPRFAACQSLRRCFCGGEALSPELVARWGELFAAEMVNLYGPTETCIDATHHRFPPGARPARVPIGRPVANLRAYVLDAWSRPVPVGAPGELYLGGAGLARGYLHQPELTNQRFVPDPFSSRAGARLYRTGDLVRWLSDGTLEYLGRGDTQVKLRGFRIELGEVEAALTDHPSVAQAVAMVREDQPGAPRLVAYLLPANGQSPRREEVIASLGRRLPSHMIPAELVMVEEFPRTPGGKVDRSALPAPQDAVRDGMAVLPRNAHERVLAGIWAELLGLERVGTEDNFFSLGGDSIISLQMISRARRAGLVFTPQQVFQHQTVAELARVAERADAVLADQTVGEMPLPPILIRFLAGEPPQPGHFNQALLAETRPDLEPEFLRAFLTQALRTHQGLRQRLEEDGGAWGLAVMPPGEEPPLEVIDLSSAPPQRQAALITQTAARVQASLDPARGRITRMVHFRLGPERPGRLLWVVHHLGVDAVSWRVLLDDLAEAFRAHRAGDPVRLDPPPTSLRTWYAGLPDLATSPEVAAELEHWRGQLPDRHPGLPLREPLDPAQDTWDQARKESLAWDAAETACLQEAGGGDLHHLLLTALALALRDWTGRDDCLIDLESHGRDWSPQGHDLSRTVGWLTAMHPLWLALPPGGDPGDSLAAVRRALGRVPHAGVGYGILRYAHPDREVRRVLQAKASPQVSLNYLGVLGTGQMAGPLLGLAGEDPGPEQAPSTPLAHPLAVAGLIQARELRLELTYNRRLLDRQTMIDLGRSLREHLARLAASGLAGGEAVEESLPATPVQEGMIFHGQLEEGDAPYHLQHSFVMEGPLDEAAWREAWRLLLERHPILRTRFETSPGGEVRQQILRRADLEMALEDWSGLDREGQEGLRRRLEAEEMAKPIPLERPPLLRLRQADLGEGRRLVVWTMHHILVDGWSLPLVVTDLGELYRAQVEERPPRLPRRRPFREYLNWLAGQDRDADRRFWREYLAGVGGPTPLPLDRLALAAPDREPGHLALERSLSRDLTQSLTAAVRARRLTLSTFLNGAWALLLARYGGGREVVFGTTLSGRPADLAGVEEMVGLFIATVPLRVSVDPALPALDLMQTLQAGQAEREAHAHLPLTEIRAQSDLSGDEPLFETIVVVENFPFDAAITQDLGGLALGGIRDQARTHYPLTMVIKPGEQLRLQALYDPRRLDSGGVERLLAHLEGMLSLLAQDPTRPAGDLDPMTPAEREQVLVTCNQTRREYPRGQGIHHLVVQQARRYPDRPALAMGGETLTYAELVSRAAGLAGVLAAKGAGPDRPVGICLERSPAMAVAVLAVLQAGAACLPLDPSYPEERRRLVLGESGCRLVVTQPSLAASLEGAGAELVMGEADAHAGAEALSEPPPGFDPESLAYVLYTSGSTGRPKGVAMPHRALVNLIDWQVSRPYFAAGARTLQFAPLGFDVSFQEIFSTWCSGGCLVLVDEETRRDPQRLWGLVAEAGVRRLFLPYVALRHLAAWAPETLPQGIEAIITAGEQLQITPELRALFAALPGCALVNQYGPTETHAVSEEILEGPPRTWPTLPAIGRPVANTRLYVLDQERRPLPLGAVGELWAAGDCLARGYLGRPELSAERFLPDPFDPSGMGRIYRTGDLVRRLGDGSLHFVGRADDQIKVRGHRVEPGEIEALLAGHPAVSQAAVVPVADKGRIIGLAAFLVPSGGEAPEPEALRGCLAEALPPYMVPESYTVLDHLPLTPSGKVDRRSLAGSLPRRKGHGEAPRTPYEEVVAGAWCEVLGLERVGRADDFFALGGHSLLAARVATLLRTATGLEVPVALVFQHPRLEALAASLDRLRRESAIPAEPRLQAGSASGDLPLSHEQERLWFLEQIRASRGLYHIGGGLICKGPLDIEALRQALELTTQRHQALRARFHDRHGHPVMTIADPAPLDLPLIDCGHLAPELRLAEAKRLAGEELDRPFDLAAEPPLRVRLIRLEPDRHVLVLVLHHLVADGWSLGIVGQDLAQAYGDLIQGRQPRLPRPSLDIADYNRWQRSYLEGAALEEHLVYWREQMAGAPPLLELPLDRPRPAVPSHRGGIEELHLDQATASALRRLAASRGASPFMVLLAAWAALLARYSGQEEVVVGAPMALRAREETKEMVGFLVNTLPLRCDLRGEPGFAELVDRVARVCLAAYAHQEAPLDRLVEALQPRRHLGHSPIFQTVLALQRPNLTNLSLPGMEVEAFEPTTQRSRFDLTLTLADGEPDMPGWLEYDGEILEAATVRRMAGHFQRLLAAALAQPELPLGRLPLMRDQERDLILGNWAGRVATGPEPDGLVERFLAAAQTRPGSIAIASGEDWISYAGLEERSARLAGSLRALGVGPESLVALCLEEGAEMFPAILAVWRAGGAYLPLDPRHPPARLAQTLADSGAGLVLTSSQLSRLLPEDAVRVVCMDRPGDLPPGEAEITGELPLPAPSDLAYVIYTSGSTGRPKGVEVTHGSLAWLLESAIPEMGVTAASRLLQHMAFTFDASLLEMVLALGAGAALHIAPAGASAGKGLADCLREQAITHALLTPSMAAVTPSEDLPFLETVLLGGEALDDEVARRWAQGRRVINGYGPTECTVAATMGDYRPGPGRPPLGRPLDHVLAYVLDGHGQPVPVGVAGELYLGGPGVARGYRGREDLTRERFLPNPFLDRPGARLYRTGDLVRWLPSGELDFLGRLDNQVKLRGYRIELGEVEAVLREHPGVDQAAALVREDRPGDRRLVAYHTAARGQHPQPAELRDHLTALLPDYMIPAALVALERMPLTAHGKVDPGALPAPAWESPAQDLRPPETPSQVALAQVWRDLLGLERVGRDDDFFRLGGSSLLAARLVGRIRAELARDLELEQVFLHPTLAGLAQALDDVPVVDDDDGLEMETGEI